MLEGHVPLQELVLLVVVVEDIEPRRLVALDVGALVLVLLGDEVKEICPRGNNKVIIYIPYIMLNVYYSCYNYINRKLSTCVNT